MAVFYRGKEVRNVEHNARDDTYSLIVVAVNALARRGLG